jgi:hypothetical protein
MGEVRESDAGYSVQVTRRTALPAFGGRLPRGLGEIAEPVGSCTSIYCLRVPTDTFSIVEQHGSV